MWEAVKMRIGLKLADDRPITPRGAKENRFKDMKCGQAFFHPYTR